MAPGPDAWGYIGSSGYYQGMQGLANQQNALQNVANQQGGFGGLLGGISSTNPYGAVNQLAMQYYQPQQMVVSGPTIESLFQGANIGSAKVKARAKRLVDRLRAEIDEWHGDVLCRMETA